jgi:hypothetical protein
MKNEKRKFHSIVYHFPLWLLADVHSLFLQSFFNEKEGIGGRINFTVAFEGKI